MNPNDIVKSKLLKLIGIANLRGKKAANTKLNMARKKNKAAATKHIEKATYLWIRVIPSVSNQDVDGFSHENVEVLAGLLAVDHGLVSQEDPVIALAALGGGAVFVWPGSAYEKGSAGDGVVPWLAGEKNFFTFAKVEGVFDPKLPLLSDLEEACIIKNNKSQN